ncbi:hypothetical protein B0T26DRAFT_760997 [Lasiosphaeria miniovina]|uniref:C2H2-type domain-containing protein n=1 Tax=Lasiosphaeria miniovina TaxID=1954250 RepID=A0AA40BH53_9PEZI|nr:uncharacterized protein B0T26DRAFT_760997 [Lasiosphaeria miniovina]KAK0734157.1 hypothetical protein B0T26DRAFT_760997 [Lasiosphaeria miniovina]
MSSTYTLYPSSVADNTATQRERTGEPHNLPPQDGQQYYIQPSTPLITGHLSTFSPQIRSNSGSPALNSSQQTPADSTPLSIHYQSSEYSEAGDPFFGVNFNEEGSPSFLDDEFPLGNDELLVGHQGAAYLPLSPDKTPSLHTSSPEQKGDRAIFAELSREFVPTQELSILTNQSSISAESPQPGYQLTPQTSGSGKSSDDGLAPAAAIMPAHSPRVTVSMYGKDHLADETVSHEPQPTSSPFAPARDNTGTWMADRATGQRGLGPDSRPATEVPSLNELTAQRELNDRNHEVDEWLARSRPLPTGARSHTGIPVHEQPSLQPIDGDDNVPLREIELGDETENNPVPGQTYYVESGGMLTEQDVEIMRQNRNWADAPLTFSIFKSGSSRYQPETSQAAIEKFEKMCRDNASFVSRAATWGTRRRSLPSVADIDGVTSGNFLKKLSLSRGDTRRPSIFKELRGLVRKPSGSRNKRSRGDNDDAASRDTDSSPEREQSRLAPPSPSPGRGKKQGVPSINTAFIAMGSNIASIGTTHARSGSISATPITSPKSPSGFSLGVRKPLNRIRSKSDLTKNQTSSIADMWKKSGGPPVANLAKAPANMAEPDDEDDDDDDLDDMDIKQEADKTMHDITPNFAGFQQHVLKLNPLLATTNNYLVDRIAHQQIVRYKSLLNSRVKHLQCTAAKNCPCGAMCIALGGSANVLDSKGDARGLDPMSARYDGSDGDITPLEGAINPDSFPIDIPMPPTSTLPAEFECQLCFQAKKFQKPSDWTKHVHEDVQPFTCTWDRCRDPKIFKRKADWVRHENEGHRHLEWWTCDYEDCRHVCYRRDNFLQHLVREHKFPEPKVKTKAAIKRAGGMDPTWQKVEQCHEETRASPHDEPCRFCAKTFPTWKKLTVHLAKHMEQISLPILKLVARKDLEADTIISPVQDPPPRPFPTIFATKQEPRSYDPSSANMSHTPLSHQPGGLLAYPNAAPAQQTYGYQPIVPPGFQSPIYGSGYDVSVGMGGPTPLSMANIAHHPVTHGYANLDTQAYANLPVTTTYIGAPNQYSSVAPDLEPFPAMVNMNALGLSDPNTVQMQYGGHMMDPRSAGPDQYTPHGSVSPFSHSPHQGQSGFYQQ